MIIDSSAVVAIMLDEPECDDFTRTVSLSDRVGMSAASYLETSIVIDRRRDAILSRQLDDLLDRWQVRIEPVTATQATIARAAYRDFGRGSGHAANLNFGDCLSYALAKDLDQPLLFKGNDFIHTDVRRAI